ARALVRAQVTRRGPALRFAGHTERRRHARILRDEALMVRRADLQGGSVAGRVPVEARGALVGRSCLAEGGALARRRRLGQQVVAAHVANGGIAVRGAGRLAAATGRGILTRALRRAGSGVAHLLPRTRAVRDPLSVLAKELELLRFAVAGQRAG